MGGVDRPGVALPVGPVPSRPGWGVAAGGVDRPAPGACAKAATGRVRARKLMAMDEIGVFMRYCFAAALAQRVREKAGCALGIAPRRGFCSAPVSSPWEEEREDR